jgi:hypothetical protein
MNRVLARHFLITKKYAFCGAEPDEKTVFERTGLADWKLLGVRIGLRIAAQNGATGPGCNSGIASTSRTSCIWCRYASR